MPRKNQVGIAINKTIQENKLSTIKDIAKFLNNTKQTVLRYITLEEMTKIKDFFESQLEKMKHKRLPLEEVEETIESLAYFVSRMEVINHEINSSNNLLHGHLLTNKKGEEFLYQQNPYNMSTCVEAYMGEIKKRGETVPEELKKFLDKCKPYRIDGDVSTPVTVKHSSLHGLFRNYQLNSSSRSASETEIDLRDITINTKQSSRLSRLFASRKSIYEAEDFQETARDLRKTSKSSTQQNTFFNLPEGSERDNNSKSTLKRIKDTVLYK